MRHIIKYILFLFVVGITILFPSVIFAQNLIIEPFEGNKPLPSGELYDIEEDDFGNKWIASDVGVIKITGNVVTHYTKADGLAENVILYFYKDDYGTLWAAGINGSLTLIKDGQFSALPMDFFTKKYNPYKRYIRDISIDTNGDIYLIIHSTKNIFIVKKNKLYKTIEKYTNKIFGNEINILINKKILHGTSKYINLLANGNYFNYGKITLDQKINAVKSYVEKDSIIYFLLNDLLIKTMNNKIQYEINLKSRILCVTKIDDKIFVGQQYHGYKIIDDNERITSTKNILSDKSVSNILKDKEGNIWFTTLEKGLYTCKSKKFEKLTTDEVGINKFILLPSGIRILINNSELLNSDGERTSILSKNTPIHDILYVYSKNNLRGKYYLTYTGIIKEANNVLEAKAKKILAHIKFFVNLNNTTLFFFGYEYFIIINENNEYQRMIRSQIICAEGINDSTVWIGTQNKGIYAYTVRNDDLIFKHFGNSFRINAIHSIDSKNIAIGSNDGGAFIADPRGNIKHKINGLPYRIQCINHYKNHLFIGTKEGLYIYNLLNGKTQIINSSNYLPFDEIIHLEVYGNQLYIAGKYTALRIHIQTLLYQKPIINIKTCSIDVNGKEWHTSLKKLSHNENTITFRICNSSYRAAKSLTLRYSLTKNGKIFYTDSTDNLFFNLYLHPGSYQLIIQAQDRLSGEKSNALILAIYIKPAFYETWWFIIPSIFLTVLLICIIVYYIIKKIKTRENNKRELTKKIIELEKMALQSQMNPHFLFNAINSIQDYILSNDQEKAHHYLSEFAKLIRFILKHNRQKVVSISEEIELLKTYVGLEEQRIKDSIELQVSIENNIDADDVQIPTLLLQPVLENAIWHGLNKSIVQKKINIFFSIKDNHFLMIKIENNGIEIKDKNILKESFGLHIIQERVRLLYVKEPMFTYFSIENKMGNTGVLVTLILPLDNIYNDESSYS